MSPDPRLASSRAFVPRSDRSTRTSCGAPTGGRRLAGGWLLAAALGIAAPFALITARHLAGQADPASRASNQPVAPFRILGNLYSVGASEVTSFLLATGQGLILLDGGFVETAPQIRENVARLGFRLRDVKILLGSHAHSDHAGGLAQLKAWTGARLLASAGDAPLLEAGGRNDPFFGDRLAFPPVKVDHVLRDGEAVTLGKTTMVAHLTPGHTRGCTTWTTRLTEGGRGYDVVFVCSTSVLPGYRLIDRPTYPGIAEDFARTFATLAALPCDVFLGSHASFYGGAEKARRLRAGAQPNPFIDPQGYRAYLAAASAAFRDRLAAERAAAAHAGPAAPPR
ncbi:MAG: subclass B3 metallo-beta-lactamase [Acidobacteria bacterium]|nr:subclass B3 metallo-beta-lactamase [Acidobacteriota bacterium]